MPVRQVGECACADPGRNARIVAEFGQCVIVCGAEIEPKNILCRPCALGNHTGQPCEQYVRSPVHHLQKTCLECGFDAALHKRGSDGSLN